MRVVQVLTLSLIIGGAAASWLNATRSAESPRSGKSVTLDAPPPQEPLVRAERFEWIGDALCVQIRLTNNTPAPLGYAGMVGTPIRWTCTSDDGVHWGKAETTWLGCRTGFGTYWLKPGATHSFASGGQTTYRRGRPFVKFGTAVFEGGLLDWQDGRVVWSGVYKVGRQGDPEPVAMALSSAVFSPTWPRLVKNERQPNGRYRLTFESDDAVARISREDFPAFWARGTDENGTGNAIALDPLNLGPGSLEWKPKAGGGFVLSVEPDLDLPKGFQLRSLSVVFQAAKGDAVRLKRISAGLQDGEGSR